MTVEQANPFLSPLDHFEPRHLGPRERDMVEMLATLGLSPLDALSESTVPAAIQMSGALKLGAPMTEAAAIDRLRAVLSQNRVFRSHIGMGYSPCITPPVILRNILEGPGWYTQYTPYQSEISQGRLEALLNFQTMVADLTGLPLSNASLLDEGTAAAEAMYMAFSMGRDKRRAFFVAADCHPQTIDVVRSRALPLGIEIVVGDPQTIDPEAQGLFGALVQYPTSDGRIETYDAIAARLHKAGALLVMAADLLALTILRPPGEIGADIAVGSTQRFGVPMGFGGPHAAYMATRDDYKRHLPGRVIGVSRDARGKMAYRLAIQTREQHIRRDKATSNICTAQVLLAIIASMYAVYHGPEGLRRIALRVHGLTLTLAEALRRLGYALPNAPCFDTLRVSMTEGQARDVLSAAAERHVNLRVIDGQTIGVSLDETTTPAHVADLIEIFACGRQVTFSVETLMAAVDPTYPEPLRRRSAFMTHPVFHSHHSEHELLRYIHRLQSRDLSLTTSMIPLGSCTMKLNATSEMLPVTWPEVGAIHPFAPSDQTRGYQAMFRDLETWLAEITGFAATSLQPNAGSQGEYAGLLVIRAYHHSRGDTQRDVCLIPKSAHGTNPASAAIAGFRVVVVECDELGNVDLADLRKKADEHAARLGALMVTYPSTHGVFEESIKEICALVHERGGQVYMDGANMNAQVGLCRPGDIGADVCHLNLHKTFCIPHGGGGPGMGPICVAKQLVPYLPGHPVVPTGGEKAIGAISAAPYGSPSILVISWMYIAMMGASGLRRATQVAILNANYMAKRLGAHYRVLYAGKGGRVAHEFIIDARTFKATAGVEVEDIAKRLMDYGFHAPTMSFPVAGTLMIEPTESESRGELDRLCDALIAIRQEIRAIEEGRMDRDNNALKNAPHPADVVSASEWTRPYTREQAAYPAPWLREHKYWPPVSRTDNTYGDRNLVCTCPAPETFTQP